jgi:hypothetical protein
MQLESAAHLERLRATGCPDRRLHRLPTLFETLLADTPVLLVGRENGLLNLNMSNCGVLLHS